MWGTPETFSQWAAKTHAQLIAREAADVPCGTCTACCRASQFIHIEEGEEAFAAIPQALRVAAPGSPGVQIMGHDENGHCPMLVDDACSIYAKRPIACRAYDCRIFSAAGVFPDKTQPEIASRARQWHFSPASNDGNTVADDGHEATKKAAGFLKQNQQTLFGAVVNEIQLSLSALKIHHLFVSNVGLPNVEQPNVEQIKAILRP